MKVLCYSSFTFSYLNRARVLFQTVRRFHPDWELVALITDRPPGGFLFDPAEEPFDRLVWAEDLGMGRRAFTRAFRRETGMSFAEWRQQACLLVALPRLAAGEPVTAIALDLGYDSPAAFATMFKRLSGMPPSRYQP